MMAETLNTLKHWFRRAKGTPMTSQQLERMKSLWWYYTVQLHDGSMVQGIYPDHLAFLPRLMQKKLDLSGMDCLDIGSAEGILPILAKKGGARSVTSVDHSPELFAEKFEYLKSIHAVDIESKFIGRAQNVSAHANEFPPSGFDYVNLSGVLYHVTSPLDTIAAARTLLKPNGLMLVSTIIIVSDLCYMEFNDRGRLQSGGDVFWYVSVGMLDC